MTIINRENFGFVFNQTACLSCFARCCRGKSGNIWVAADDMKNICNFLNINLIDGMSGFFEKRDNRYSIKEQIDTVTRYNDNSNFDNIFHEETRWAGKISWKCVFLDRDNNCTIYPVRPFQCRTFPFWEQFKSDISQLFKECPGVVII